MLTPGPRRSGRGVVGLAAASVVALAGLVAGCAHAGGPLARPVAQVPGAGGEHAPGQAGAADPRAGGAGATAVSAAGPGSGSGSDWGSGSGADRGSGSGPDAANATRPGAPPVLAGVHRAATFGQSYRVTGRMTMHVFGTDHDVPPPSSAVSTWKQQIATVWVRGRTAYGEWGFSLSFADFGFRRLNRVDYYVPQSTDPAHPRDGVIDLPFAHPVRWLARGVGVTSGTTTQDGSLTAAVTWVTPTQVSIALEPAPGHDPPANLRHGTMTVDLAGPRADPWRRLQIDLAMSSDRGDITGTLELSGS